MNDELDFTGLTDDQLEALIRGACAEASRRGPCVADAVRSVLLDASECSRRVREAAEREVLRVQDEEARRAAETAAAAVRTAAETERSASSWSTKKWFAQQLDALYREVPGYESGLLRGAQLHVWRSGGETRVFLGCGYDKNHVTLYVTGRAKNPPGSLEYGDRDFKPYADRVRVLLAAAARTWPQGAKVDLRAALDWAGDASQPAAVAA
jgi:hypothetical protein